MAHPFAVLAAHAVDERLQLGQEGRRAGRLRPAIGPAIGRDAIGRDAIGRPASRGVGLNRASRDRRGVVALDHHPEGGERSGRLERGSGVAGRQKLAEPEEGGAGEVGGEGAQHVPAATEERAGGPVGRRPDQRADGVLEGGQVDRG